MCAGEISITRDRRNVAQATHLVPRARPSWSGSRFFGRMMLRFTTAGESHGPGLISVLEGMVAGLPLLAEDVNRELARRQQGYGRGRRMQIELDEIEFLSGVRAGQTMGSPISMLIRNRDWKNWQDVMDPAPREGDPDPRRR